VSFDPIATHYRWIETLAFGRALQRARTRWLPDIARPKHVLIVGEGDGCFLRELLRAHPKIRIDCADASANMLQLARKRIERSSPESLDHVRFLHRDIRKWSPTHAYDLLVTHFVLDCFPKEEMQMIVAKLAAAASNNAIWLLSDFTVPKQPLARLHATVWIHAMYAFFRLTTRISARTIVDPTPFLVDHGFVRIKRSLSRSRMIKSELYLATCQSGGGVTRGNR
jgi:ubiquinone/menaquinone biosynthesis C-methylase UbiE